MPTILRESHLTFLQNEKKKSFQDENVLTLTLN
jgi:hypothetical protein